VLYKKSRYIHTHIYIIVLRCCVLFCLCLVEEAVKNKEREDILTARSFLDNSTLLSVISVNRYITGITVMDSELFVVGGLSSQVAVYNTNNFTWTHHLFIPGSLSLRAIVASPRHNCLYISDEVRRLVYRYNLSNNVLTHWSVGGDCYGLSLTSTDNLLVALLNIHQINGYSPDGSLIRKLSLDSSIAYPMHCVQLSSDRFVVSHSGSLHRVCLVDTNGSVPQCYGGFQGSGVGQLNRPRHLAVDGQGNVLVSDWGNNRVVLLSPSFTHLGCIEIPGHQLSQPWALHLDRLNLRVYIGERNDTGRVFVLTI